MKFNFQQHGFDELAKLPDKMRKQVKFATAKTLTGLAKRTEGAMRNEMAGEFSPMSPYVNRSMFVQSANKNRLTAVVGLKDKKPAGGTAPSTLLKEHFTGDERGNKPFEKALMAMGVLPRGYRAIVGEGLKLNKLGNPTKGQIEKLLKAAKSPRDTQFFVIKIGTQSHLPAGIWRRAGRKGSKVKPMLIFVRRADYSKILDFMKTGEKVIGKYFDADFNKNFAEAMRTAK